MGLNFRDYWVRKLLLPNIIIIDKPGIIVSRVAHFYGKSKSCQRLAFYFEQTMIDLQNATIEKYGREKTSEIWYKIGKDAGTRYFLLSGGKAPVKLLVPLVIKYIFEGFRSAGMSFANNCHFVNDGGIILSGSGSMICRKTGNSAMCAGLVSSVLSCLWDKNIEARSSCLNCPSGCKIVAKKSIPEIYIPDKISLMPSKFYHELNFPKNPRFLGKYYSLSELLRFKKIYMNNLNQKISFGKNILIPSEIGLYGVTMSRYIELGDDFYKDVLIKSAKKISSELFVGDNKERKLTDALKFLSSMGWGMISFKRLKGRLNIDLLYTPFSKYDDNYILLIINGFLNDCFGKKYLLKEVLSRGKIKKKAVFVESSL